MDAEVERNRITGVTVGTKRGLMTIRGEAAYSSLSGSESDMLKDAESFLTTVESLGPLFFPATYSGNSPRPDFAQNNFTVEADNREVARSWERRSTSTTAW